MTCRPENQCNEIQNATEVENASTSKMGSWLEFKLVQFDERVNHHFRTNKCLINMGTNTAMR